MAPPSAADESAKIEQAAASEASRSMRTVMVSPNIEFARQSSKENRRRILKKCSQPERDCKVGEQSFPGIDCVRFQWAAAGCGSTMAANGRRRWVQQSARAQIGRASCRERV